MMKSDKPRRPVEDGMVIVDCGPCLRRCGLHRLIPKENSTVWFVKDICGIICVILTWLLILYAEYVVMFIMLIPSPHYAYSWGNGVLFNFFVMLAVASHSKAMLTDPGAVPKGNATRENIMKMGLKEGQVVFKCPKCISIKPERAHHCSVCQRCIRKMDHHCPWVNNCVGENNQKYFVLFTLYICLISIHAIYMSVQHFIICIGKDWKECSGVSPPATTIFLIFLVFEGLLFGIFTAIMFGSQLSAICSDETVMAKSHAQWQKECRERKKAEQGSKWLENESKQTKKYYTKIGQLDEQEAKKQRKRFQMRQIKYREKKRQKKRDENETHNEQREVRLSTSTDVQSSEISSSDTKMVVKLSYQKRKKSSEKKLRNRIEYLERVKCTVEKRNQTLRKKLSRLSKQTNSPRTPRSISNREMFEARISQNQAIKKKLLFANCLSYQLKQKSGCDNRSGRRLIKYMIAGNILRKYKMVHFAEKFIGVKFRKKEPETKPSEHYGNKESVRRVREFLTNEDNSRQMPGKNDTVKNANKERVQKFVLGDYLRNLYLKFMAENEGFKMSFATFCRARHKHVTLVNYAARITCLCTRHQNFALKLQSLKKYGVTSNTSPDSFAQSVNTDELQEKMKATIHDTTVKFKEWKRVKCDDDKQRTKLIEIEKDKETYVKDVATEFDDFKSHAERVKIQFQSFKHMKDSLKYNKNHVFVQMDFAENYSVKEMEEIQSAYWNPESVTLHPVVIYYSNNDKVEHSSMVVISEVLNHNSSMVTAILNKVAEFVKDILPEARYIHYWTDSPTSQYRNKTMFDMITRHERLFGMKASWQYFEAGHGKGACDGIGGVVKRSADTAIKTGKVSITCGKDFYEWGCKTDSQIRYAFFEKTEYEEAAKQIEERQKDITPAKGTLKLHSVASISKYEIMVRDTTCVCENCFTEHGFVLSDTNRCNWRKHNLQNLHTSKQSNNKKALPTELEPDVSENEKADSSESMQEEEPYEVDNYIAAEYEGGVYIGKIIAIDEGAEEPIKVTFMENGSKVKVCLKWPSREDIMTLTADAILCKVQEPFRSGTRGRFCKITDEDREKIAKSANGQ